ncbi:MAG: hypothetical protein QG573_2935 [Acidobacteriota bacterium]|nr:hypothetical protein [Acidobacteriota bacterium]
MSASPRKCRAAAARTAVVRPAVAQLVPEEATIFRLSTDADLAVGVPGNSYGGGHYGSIQVFCGASDGLADPAAGTPLDDSNGFQLGLVAVLTGGPLFNDGFETGDTDRWSSTVP